MDDSLLKALILIREIIKDFEILVAKMNLKNSSPKSTDVARHLQPWEKMCIHDIVTSATKKVSRCLLGCPISTF